MKRRDFIKTSAIAVAVSAITPIKVFSNISRKIGNTIKSFSLEVITSNPDYAVTLLQEFAKTGNLEKGEMNYSEYPVSGQMMGDLIYVDDNNLINYTKLCDDMSLKLIEIRKKLELPKIIEKPVRLKLYRNNGEKSKSILVTHKGEIIKNFNLLTDDSYTLNGSKGKLILKVTKGNAYVSESECKHQICKITGSIRNAGDYITCIPNELHFVAE
jgi:hypothetical protein